MISHRSDDIMLGMYHVTSCIMAKTLLFEPNFTIKFLQNQNICTWHPWCDDIITLETSMWWCCLIPTPGELLPIPHQCNNITWQPLHNPRSLKWQPGIIGGFIYKWKISRLINLGSPCSNFSFLGKVISLSQSLSQTDWTQGWVFSNTLLTPYLELHRLCQ